MVKLKGLKSILIFGSSGFIGSNIISYFESDYNIITLKIDADIDLIKSNLAISDIIIHASGVSRSENESDFFKINIEYSTRLLFLLLEQKNKTIIYFSSIHFLRDDIYGFSKRYNEYLFNNLLLNENNDCVCFRIPGVFGPGSRPNYVSVVSTFCYNFANNFSSKIIEPQKNIDLIFIGDILKIIESVLYKPYESGYTVIEPKSVKISVGELYSLIQKVYLNKDIDLIDFGNIEFIKQIILTYKYYKNNAKPKRVSK